MGELDTVAGDIDYEAVVKLAENFNGADLRNVCTEGGMFAIRDERDYIVQVNPLCIICSTPTQQLELFSACVPQMIPPHFEMLMLGMIRDSRVFIELDDSTTEPPVLMWLMSCGRRT